MKKRDFKKSLKLNNYLKIDSRKMSKVRGGHFTVEIEGVSIGRFD